MQIKNPDAFFAPGLKLKVNYLFLIFLPSFLKSLQRGPARHTEEKRPEIIPTMRGKAKFLMEVTPRR